MSPAKAEQEAKETYDGWGKSLSQGQSDAVKGYTVISRHINDLARGLPPHGSAPPSESTKAQIAELDKAIESAPPTKSPMKAFRTMPLRAIEGLSNGDPQSLVGAELGDKGFCSTTLDSKVAEEMYGLAEVVVEISLPKGTKGAYLGEGVRDDSVEDQKEFLLPRGSKFKISKVEESKTGGYKLTAELVQ